MPPWFKLETVKQSPEFTTKKQCINFRQNTEESALVAVETGELAVEPSDDLPFAFFVGVVMIVSPWSLPLKQSGLPGMVSTNSCESATTTGGPEPFCGVASQAGGNGIHVQTHPFKDIMFSQISQAPTLILERKKRNELLWPKNCIILLNFGLPRKCFFLMGQACSRNHKHSCNQGTCSFIFCSSVRDCSFQRNRCWTYVRIHT